LIALIALFQTASPVSRKATNNTSQVSKNGQNKASADQAPTDEAKPATNLANPPPNQQAGPTQTNADEHKTEPVRVAPVDIQKDWTDYLYILASLLLTLITLGIAIFAAIQARAAKRSADNDEKSVRLTERADVLLEGAGFDNPIQGHFDGNSRIILSFKNFGRTRANHTLLKVELIIPGVPNTPPPFPAPKITIGAGDSQTVSFASFFETLTPATFMGICDGSIKLIFVGEIMYDDVFGTTHTVDCGGEFHPRTRNFEVTKDSEREPN
jgi:hypothetical protein